MGPTPSRYMKLTQALRNPLSLQDLRTYCQATRAARYPVDPPALAWVSDGPGGTLRQFPSL